MSYLPLTVLTIYNFNKLFIAPCVCVCVLGGGGGRRGDAKVSFSAMDLMRCSQTCKKHILGLTVYLI